MIEAEFCGGSSDAEFPVYVICPPQRLEKSILEAGHFPVKRLKGWLQEPDPGDILRTRMTNLKISPAGY